MKTENGQVAWMSKKTKRIFSNIDDAVKDAQDYNWLKFNDDNLERAHKDIKLVHLWLNKE